MGNKYVSKKLLEAAKIYSTVIKKRVPEIHFQGHLRRRVKNEWMEKW